jgi:hypothetical protein
MAVSVSSRTVWFAVCQHCTRAAIEAGGVMFATVTCSFASEADRDGWEAAHNADKAHPSPDTVVWSVTAMVHGA